MYRMTWVRTLMAKSGKGSDFPAYADQVRAIHKAKRNLMRPFDRQDWIGGRMSQELGRVL
jgi:hypothetical protein